MGADILSFRHHFKFIPAGNVGVRVDKKGTPWANKGLGGLALQRGERVGSSAITTTFTSMNLFTILDRLERTVPAHTYDTLASHMQYIGMLEGLMKQLLDQEMMREDIREDKQARRAYTLLSYNLKRAYETASRCSPLANSYGFIVEPCADYWRLNEALNSAGIII